MPSFVVEVLRQGSISASLLKPPAWGIGRHAGLKGMLCQVSAFVVESSPGPLRVALERELIDGW